MRTLHRNQQLILKFLLKKNLGATLDEIASHLQITKTAAKEHILKVEAHGYLTYRDSKGSVGRPRRHYLLSEEGHNVFPKQYSWLSNHLLGLLAENMGKDWVIHTMSELANKVAQMMSSKLQNAKSTSELLTKINTVMNDLGYQSQIKQKDVRKGAILEATNCVYHSIAKQHPELCHFDVKFLENASNLNVQLEKCIARGDSVCRFCLRSKNK